MSEDSARIERGGAEQPAPAPPSGVDPLDAAQQQARYASEGSSLPSETGLGPGAGEAPVASVSAGIEEEGTPVPANPSMAEPPHTQERPQTRSSQLDEGG